MGTYIDWRSVRARWQAGESSYQISKSLSGSPSRQGIEKRIKRENWQRNGTTTADDNLGNSQTWLQQIGTYQPVGDKDHPETRAIILSEISNGAPRSLAAKLAGVHDDTLRRWCQKDARFAGLVRQAERAAISPQIKSIVDAGKGGDWKASAYLLERHNTSRDHFAPPAKGQGFGAVNVTLNVIRGESVTIEGEAEEVEDADYVSLPATAP